MKVVLTYFPLCYHYTLTLYANDSPINVRNQFSFPSRLYFSIPFPSPTNLIDTSTGLIDSAGLIPSQGTNTYGALGIGIGSGARSVQGTSHGSGHKHSTSISVDNEKKRKVKIREEESEFVCRDCGTVDSPGTLIPDRQALPCR